MDDEQLLLPLSRGKFATIDASDYKLISAYRWRAVHFHRAWYAVTNPKPVYKPILMHRLIMGMKQGERCDHRDHDGLNNRRGNLRPCTHSQNMANNRRPQGGTGFKGVSRNGPGWMARIGRRSFHLGTFATAKLAAAAYDKAAIEKYGEFAVTNSSLGLL